MRTAPLVYCFLLLITHQGLSQKRFIIVDTSKIFIQTIGIEERQPGQPVIVFESGHGTPMDNWDRVIEASARLAPVVAYDRPGIGESEPIDELPTLKNVADRLVRILEQLELEPPYILVGHSLGGVYVRGFAVYYPEKLAGLVIIDPGDFTETHDNSYDYYEVLGWERPIIDSLIQSLIDIRVARGEKGPPAIKQESQVLETLRTNDFREIAENPLPNIPVHIIAAGRFDMPTEFRSTEYDDEALFRSKVKHRISRWTDVVQSVDRGMLFYSGDAGHFVQWDDPELVISSIRIVLIDYKEMQSLK